MASDAVVRARIDAEVKEEAGRVLAEMGLTVSDAIRLMLVRVAAEKAMPFPIRVPNAETIAAMEEARSGQLRSYASMGELLASIDEED